MPDVVQLNNINKESAENEDSLTLEDLIKKYIGSFKRWQLLIFLSICMVNILQAWLELSIIFLAPDQDYTCSMNVSKCSAECPSHVFDKSNFTNTITSQWDLTCDREQLKNFAQSTLMMGGLVGNVLFGYISDRYGRRKPLIAIILIQSVAGICTAFSPTLWFFMICRFIVGTAGAGSGQIAIVMVLEITDKNHRSILGVLYQIAYFMSYSIMGALGYYLRDWQDLQLVISVPTLMLLSYYWTLPESPCWLLTVNRTEEAINVLENAAKFNGMPTEKIREEISTISITGVQESNVLSLFKTPNLRNRTIFLWFIWLITGFTYFGVAQYMGQIAGNIFINVAIAGAIQIPGNLVIIFVMDKFGRKKTLLGTYAICGLSLLGITLLPSNPTWPTTLLGGLGMMGISVSFAVISVFTGELYPTVIRNLAMGSCTVSTRVGSITAPFVLQLSHTYIWLPPVIYGLGPLLSVVLCLSLPETLGKHLPNTIADVEGYELPTRSSTGKLFNDAILE